MDCLSRIRELLDMRGWSMYQLSQRSGIPQSTLSNLFIRNNAPTIPTLEKICDVFGITLGDFFGNSSAYSMQETELIAEWRELPENAKITILDLIKAYNKTKD